MKTPNSVRLSILILLFVGVILPHASSAQGDPVGYSNFFANMINGIDQMNLNYTMESVHSDDTLTVETNRNRMVDQLELMIQRAKNRGPYGDDASLMNAAVSMMEVYKETYEVDFVTTSKLRKDRESSYEALEKYYTAQDDAERKLEQARDAFTGAQLDFFGSNNVQVGFVEHEQAKVVETITAVNQYTRDVYLIFFRVSKQNAIFMDAMDKRDIEKMKSACNNMKAGVTKSLIEIEEIGAFREETLYQDKTRDVLTLFKELSYVKFPRLIEVLEKQKAGTMVEEDALYFNEFSGFYNREINTKNNAFNQASVALQRKFIPSND